MRLFLTFIAIVSTNNVFAQQISEPVVGSHVANNMNALSMVVSLLIVLAVIFVLALLLKRFNLVQNNHTELKVITSLMLGSKEKIVVVQVGEKQLLLGVTAQQISIISTLDKPICVENTASEQANLNVPSSLLNLFNKRNNAEHKK